MRIRDATAADWPAIWPIVEGVVRAGETFTYPRDEGYRAMQFNAVVETNTRAVSLWRSLGFEVMATLPEAFLHPAQGYVGLHVMYRLL